MKRTVRGLIVLICTLLLAACGCGRQAPADDRPSVVVTIFPQYDFIRTIAGDRVRLSMLAKPGSEVHGYDPTFSEVAGILNADLFVYIGGESDNWVETVLNKAETPVNALALLPAVDALDEETVPGMQAEEEDGVQKDEHIWTSPKNAVCIVEVLCDALCAILPEEADALRANADAYIKELNDLDAQFHDVMKSAARTTVVFAERFPFRYLCDELGLTYYAALPGCSSNEEVGLSTIAYLIDRVRDEDLPGVFYIEFSDRKTANAIAEATGCETWLLHSCHNVSREDFENGVTYLDLMRQNVESLKKAVN